MKVELVFAGEHDQLVVNLDLPPGSTIQTALDQARAQLDFRSLCQRNRLDVQAMPVGVFGVICEHGRVLRDGDRVELYRPLQLDPKEARRLRERQTSA